MEESISLEETNKIRISLGLKPLTDDKAAGPEDKEKQAEDNYAKQRDRERKEKESKKIADRIAKVRNRRELNTSLKGSTLGDADADEGDDLMKWVKRSKKKEKELAKKRQLDLESRDKVFQGEGEEYTERDLAGLKVSHNLDDMDDGEARILTLKDSRILDNEEDELQNVELAEDESLKKRQESKIKKRDYTGYDDDEFADANVGMKKSVLAKYDEDIEGPADFGFRLGSSVKSTKETRAEEQHAAAAAVNKSLLSIDYVKNVEVHDYLREGDKGFKKPKTKKKRPSKRAAADAELADPNEMAVEETAIVRDMDVNFVDDDDLQAALARQRKAKLRKTAKISPEELAKKVAAQRLLEEQEESSGVKIEEGVAAMDDESGLTFDDTSEFVRAVGNNEPVVKKEVVRQELKEEEATGPDVTMAPGDQSINELEASEALVKEEEGDYDMEMLDAIEGVLKDAEDEARQRESGAEVGTSSEQTFKSGMAATLNILRQQGILSAPLDDVAQRETVQKQRDAWLAEQRHRIATREMEKYQSRGQGNMDQASREYENRMREQREARETMDLYKDYKPDVNIVYYDDDGRQLTPKEAWKALSHKFHGKGSGKMKTEKRLKKIAEEKRREAMGSGDTPTSMGDKFLKRQEKAGQAHFVLSVGNRGAVPQVDAEFLQMQPLEKGKTQKAKKKKEGKKGNEKVEESSFITLPSSGSGFSSPAPTAAKAGFKRVGGLAEEGTPSGDKSRVAFGLKRKAEDEGEGSPNVKSARRV